MKSTIHPPADDFFVNIYRSPNPFSANDEPDWIHLSRPGRSDIGLEDSSSAVQVRPQASGCELVDVSAQPESPNMGVREADKSPKTARSIKTPPPIPRKPVLLSSKESRHNISATGTARAGQDNGQTSLDGAESLNRQAGNTNVLTSQQGEGSSGPASSSASQHPETPNLDTMHSYDGSRAQRPTATKKEANDLLGDNVDSSISWKPLVPR